MREALARALEDDSEARIEDGELRLVAGSGTAEYRVSYFDEDRRLGGNGVLEVRGDEMGAGSLSVLPHDDGTDPLAVVAHDAPDRREITLGVGGRVLATLGVETVPVDAITAIELVGDEIGEWDGAQNVMYARGEDAEGRLVEGAECTFRLDGVVQEGGGDFFGYRYASSRLRTLEASCGTLQASRSVHADDGIGTTAAPIGCSVGHGGRGGTAIGALAALALVLAGRRRRAG